MKSGERNYGIDLLRSVAMFMVVVLHVLGQGGILKAAKNSSAQFCFAWILEIAAYCAVNCYALISGYVGYYSKHRYSSLVEIWLRVAFYTVMITVTIKIIHPGDITGTDFIKAFFPVSSNQYWYFTAYFIMFLFIPLIQPGLRNLSKKQIQLALALIVFMFSVAGPIVTVLIQKNSKDVFLIKNGYSMLWLLVLYILGAYIRRFDAFKSIGKLKASLGYFSMIIFTWILKLSAVYLKSRADSEAFLIKNIINLFNKSVSYCSPTIILSGLFLFLLFKDLHLPDFLKKLTAFFAPLSFSVYLIHTNPIIWNLYMKNAFASYAVYPVPKLIVAVLGTALGIFIICALADTVRNGIFKKLKVKKRLSALEDKFFSKLSQEEAVEAQ